MSVAWAEVWRRRSAPVGERLGLAELLLLDGYDTGAGRAASVEGFRSYARSIASMLALAEGEAVFEVGCGAGAFLYGLREVVGVRVAGCDLAPGLVAVASRAMPDGDFAVVAAEDLPTEPSFDIVLSNGVFYYFPDLAYAERVLRRMTAKSLRAVAILEVPDLARRHEAERLRREALPHGVYEERYAGLPHLYFARGWFADAASGLGWEAHTFDLPFPDYPQGEFRFGALLTRPRETT